MDRQKLDLLTAQANALGTALSSIPDTNESARQRCLGFAQEVRAFVKAWSNLSKALHDPQLEPRPAFVQILDRLLSDNSRIVCDLRNQLAEVRTKQAQYDAAIRSKRFLPRNKQAHLLVSFLGGKTASLRQQQVEYALSVLDVLLGVVFHAKTLGEPTTRQDEQASLQDQLARLRGESDARTRVFNEERRIGDKYVISSLWLSSVTWHSDSFDVPPFETLALQWFKIVSEDGTRESNVPTSSRMSTNNLTKIVLQLQQDLREQSRVHQHQLQEQTTRQKELRQWAEKTIEQLEFSQQKQAREAASRIEAMQAQIEVQQQTIDNDKTTIEQLKHSRSEWTTHYQKQARLLQQLEAQMKELKNENTALKHSCNEQRTGLNDLQQKYEKLQASHRRLSEQNNALRERLSTSEAEKEDLEARHARLQGKFAKAVEHNRKWKELYDAGPGQQEAQIQELQDDIDGFKDEVKQLKKELATMTGDRNQLRDSLNKYENASVTDRMHSVRLQERQSTRREPPTSYGNRSSETRSRSRHRSSSSTSGRPSRASSRETTSRASSSTFVDDSASDTDYYLNDLPRKVAGDPTSKIGSWFSPRSTRKTPAR